MRSRAAEWHIDPHKIGVVGFSAGGHMVAAMSTHFDRRSYPAVDAADKVSCRPDFAVAIYPGHLSLADNSIALNPDIRSHITRQTPPTFLLQNEDDHVDRGDDVASTGGDLAGDARHHLAISHSSGNTQPLIRLMRAWSRRVRRSPTGSRLKNGRSAVNAARAPLGSPFIRCADTVASRK